MRKKNLSNCPVNWSLGPWRLKNRSKMVFKAQKHHRAQSDQTEEERRLKQTKTIKQSTNKQTKKKPPRGGHEQKTIRERVH